MIVNSTTKDSTEQKEQLTNLFTKVGRIQFLILGLIASGLVFFGYQFITQIWAGNGYEDSYIVMLLLVLPTTIFLIQNIGIDIQRAQNRHKFRSIAYLIMSVFNLALTICLSQKYGAIGAAIGTAVSVFVVDGIVMNIYYHFKCNIDILKFWKTIARTSFGLLLPIGFGFVFNLFITNNSIIIFLIKIFAYTLIYLISIWFFSLKKDEKLWFKEKSKKLFHRRQSVKEKNVE